MTGPQQPARPCLAAGIAIPQLQGRIFELLHLRLSLSSLSLVVVRSKNTRGFTSGVAGGGAAPPFLILEFKCPQQLDVHPSEFSGKFPSFHHLNTRPSAALS